MRTLHVSVIDRGVPRERRFTRFPITIGRHPSNDLTLEHERVSRFHVELNVDGNDVVVRDRGTTNGTLISEGREVRRLLNVSVRREREVEFLVEAFHVRAILSETCVPELTAEFIGTAWDVVNRLTSADEHRPSSARSLEHFEFARHVVEELSRAQASLRMAINDRPPQATRSDVGDAVDAYLSATTDVLRSLQNSLYVLRQMGLSASSDSQFFDTILERAAVSPAQARTTLSDAGLSERQSAQSSSPEPGRC